MARFILQVALPLFAPIAVYMLWLWYAQKRAKKHGNEPPAFTKGAAFIAVLVGAVLALASIVTLALVAGNAPTDAEYRSPRYEDGRVVGPTFEDQAPADSSDAYRNRLESDQQ